MANLNDSLIGVPGGRAKLQTPALVIDLDVFERNVAHMVAHAKKAGIGLRPHAKTHKSVEIARRQIAAGANGICCAKLGEAEALAAAGIESILLTSPVVTEGGIARVMALNARMQELIIVCDNAAVATRLDAAAQASGKKLKVLVDIDPGMSRTGIRAADAPALVDAGRRVTRPRIPAGCNATRARCSTWNRPTSGARPSLQAMKELGELRDRLAQGRAQRRKSSPAAARAPSTSIPTRTC